MRGTVKVEGLRRLRTTLRKAGHDLSDLKKTHHKIGTFIINRARPSAPARPGSGKLRGSLRTGATKTASILKAGNNTRIKYANPIHWGWGRKNIPANMFLQKTARATEPTWVNMYWEQVEKILDQIKGI